MSDCIPCGCRDSLPTKELGIDEWKDEYIKLVIYTSTVSRENTKLREVISDAEESAHLILGESRALEAENAKLREYVAWLEEAVIERGYVPSQTKTWLNAKRFELGIEVGV